MLLDNLRKLDVQLELKPGLWSTNWDKAKVLEISSNIISMAWWPTVSSPSDLFLALYNTLNKTHLIFHIIVIASWIHLLKRHGS